jgi:hypothetical protein
MGSRYGGLKQMDPVGPHGATIIDYSVYDALQAGFNKLVFVIRRDIEAAFRDAVGRRFEPHVAVHYVFQELSALPAGFDLPAGRLKPWGTGHAVLMAADVVQEPFAVINADDFYGAHSFQLLADHLATDTPDSAMAGFVLRNTLSEFGAVARGVCRVAADGFLEEIRELTGIEKEGEAARYADGAGVLRTLTGDELVSMNMWGFHPALFAALREQFITFLASHGNQLKSEFYIPTVVNTLIQGGAGRVRVLPTRASWFGVTYREDRPFVLGGIRKLIEQRAYPEKLWQAR